MKKIWYFIIILLILIITILNIFKLDKSYTDYSVTGDIKNVEVNVEKSDVTIQVSPAIENIKVEYVTYVDKENQKEEPVIYEKDSTLYVGTYQDKSIFSFYDKKEVIITFPSDYNLSNVNVACKDCNILISDMNIESLNINSKFAKIRLDNVASNDTSVVMNKGYSSVVDSEINNFLVTSKYSPVYIENSILKKVFITTAFSNIQIENTKIKYLEIINTYGVVSLETFPDVNYQVTGVEPFSQNPDSTNITEVIVSSPVRHFDAWSKSK